MSGMRLVVIGEEAVRQRLVGAPVAVSKSLRESMQKALDTVYRRVSDNLTGRVLHVQSGRLRQSMQTSVEDGGLRGRVGTNVEYAEIHEYGGRTPAHRIEARRVRALRFPASNFMGPLRLTKSGKLARRQSAGSVVIVQAVEHPGSTMPSRPYMRPALRESQEEIATILRHGLAEALRGGA